MFGLIEEFISFLFWQCSEGLQVSLGQFEELIAKANYSLMDFKEAVLCHSLQRQGSSADAQESSCSSAGGYSCAQSCGSYFSVASVRNVKEMLTLQ